MGYLANYMISKLTVTGEASCPYKMLAAVLVINPVIATSLKPNFTLLLTYKLLKWQLWKCELAWVCSESITLILFLLTSYSYSYILRYNFSYIRIATEQQHTYIELMHNN